MARPASRTFPRLLRRAWRLGDGRAQEVRRCDAQDVELIHQPLDTEQGRYWICCECGQMHREPDVDDFTALYDERWSDDAIDYQPTPKKIQECENWLRRIEPYRKSARLFEVGCGFGLFLETAENAGWKVEGNDLSSVAVNYAKKRIRGTIQQGPMEQIQLDPGTYDVILLNNVFEHLEAPLMVLRSLARALRSGGVMFFQTLNGQSLSLHFSPTHWVYYGQGHLYVPTLKSLDIYFKDSGLVPVKYETHGFRSGKFMASGAPITRKTIRGVRQQNKTFDPLLASIAGRIRRGHRVKILLKKP